jgi:hypothetical protein
VAFLASLHGALRPTRLLGVDTAVIEKYENHRGIEYRLLLPDRLSDDLLDKLAGAIPGARADEFTREPDTWTLAEEIEGAAGGEWQTKMPEAAIVRFLSGESPRQGEATLYRLVLAPSPSQKLEEPAFRASLFIAARAGHVTRAGHLLGGLRASLRSVQPAYATLRFKKIPPEYVTQAIPRLLARHPLDVNISEATILSTFPFGSPEVWGLALARSRQLPADTAVPERGIVIGRSTYRGSQRELAITLRDLMTHMHIVGKNGTGKSTLLHNVGVQIMQQGHGFTLVDPRGDLVDDMIASAPQKRVNDIIVFDLANVDQPVCFNVLEGDPYAVTDQVMSVFDGLFGIYRLSRTADIAQSSIFTLALQGMTIMDLPDLLAVSARGQGFRDQLVRQIIDPGLRGFWESYDNLKANEQAQVVDPLLRRFRRLQLRPSLRACLGASKGTLNFEQIMRRRQILLVALRKGVVGDDTAGMIGSWIVTKIWQEAMRRGALPPDRRTPYPLIIDEFQNFMHLPLSFETALAEARKFGLPLILAHQNVGQLRRMYARVP